MSYKEEQRKRQIALLKSTIFSDDRGKGKYLWRSIEQEGKEEILTDGLKNLFEPIRNCVVEYCKKNKVSLWRLAGEKKDKPTGHLLSSQVACLNHLFYLRNKPDIVLKIAQKICPNIIEILKIETDKNLSEYISFEAVSDNDYLNECKEGQQPTRGKNCTSIDALIYAKDKHNNRYILPIEWKYTELYGNEDKSTTSSDKKSQHHKENDEAKGKKRLNSYSDLIDKSKQLKGKRESYRNSSYFFEPFYQLMRQTLWAEEMIRNNKKEIVKADKFIHVHVISQENKELLEKKYKCSGKNMEDTWREHLTNQDIYKIVSPRELLSGIDFDKSTELNELKSYLERRYW